MFKTFTSFFVLALVFVLLTVSGQVNGQSLTQPSPNLPPPPGTYISPSLFHQLYQAGLIQVVDVSHSKFTQSQPPPPPGLTQIHSFNSEVSMRVSTNGGATFTPVTVPNVAVQVRVTSNPTGDIGSTRFFDTEMLSLNIQGGGLPPGIMIRESPTLQSTGQTRITPTPDGQFKINSFFDIFTELSLDGGATWNPSTNGSARMALQGDPKPPVVSSSDNVPPIPGHYVSPDEFHQLFANGIVIKDISHEGFLHNHPPPADTVPGTDTFGSTVKMQVSLDGGATFQGVEAPANVSVMMHKTSPSGNPTRTFDTEMLQLDLQGGGLPPGVMIRESPTKQSTGKTSISQDPGGTFRINSFFDIFTELSTDGGGTWSPSTNGSTHMEVEAQPPPIVTTSPNVPPMPSQYVSPADYHAAYANGIIIKDVIHDGFLHNDPPPPPDSSSTHTFGSTVHLQVSMDGGTTFQPTTAQGDVTVMVRSKSNVGSTQTFDTEMLQLNLSGGSLPAGVMIRESPTKQSLGRTTITTNPGPQFAISSFFDIFTELSVDGGATWSPSVGDPVQMELTDATVTICGTKYEDLNGNGVRDLGEPGLAGWTIKATDGSGNVVATATTDALGNYCLTVEAPGSYRVAEVGQSGWTQTGGQPFYALTTAPNQNITGIDFGNFRPGSICGTKFNDLNGNGVKDPGEPGLPGWTICIQNTTAPQPSATFPTTGGTDYMGNTLATITITLYPAYGGTQIQLCASGNTTVQRGYPSGPTPSDSSITEMTLLDMVGTMPIPFPATDTFHIRHKTDRRSYGAIQGSSFPASSSFNLFYELQLPASLGNGIFVNNDPTVMGTVINTIPPGGANYLGFNTYLVRKSNPLDTLGIIKFVNHCIPTGGAPTGQRCDTCAKAPPNPVPPGAPFGTTCVTTDANGNYCFVDLPAGVYHVQEEQQAGWTQTSPSPGPITIGSGSSPSGVNFGNQNGCTYCIDKYYDENHNQQHEPSELPMSGVTFYLVNTSDVNVDSVVTNANGHACFTNVPSGDYHIVEKPVTGYTVSLPKAGFYAVSCTNGGTTNFLWLNTAYQTSDSFRTATSEDWARAADPKNKRKEIKCKPDKVEFKLNMVVPATPLPNPKNLNPTPYTKLKMTFNMATQITAIWGDGKAKQLPLTCAVPGAPDPKLKTYTYTLDTNCVGRGDTIQFDGIGLKGGVLKVTYVWTNSDQRPLSVKGTLSPLRKGGVVGDTLKPIQRLPMPDLINVLDELFAQINPPPPIVMGGQNTATDSNVVILKKPGDVLNALGKVVHGQLVLHDTGAAATCFVHISKVGKPKAGLTPDKVNNKIFAEALALKLNVLASSTQAKFPAGFGSLVYDYHKFVPGPFDGQTVDTILAKAQHYLQTCDLNLKPLPVTAEEIWQVLRRINSSFTGAIDTIHWSCVKLSLRGTRSLKAVPWLHGDPNTPPMMAPTENERPYVQVLPENYELRQNYPNPFNPTTTIEFDIPEPALVSLTVYNTLGQEVAILLNHEYLEEGTEQVEFDATNMPSGVYFYRITAQGVGNPDEGVAGQTFVSVKKMVLMK